MRRGAQRCANACRYAQIRRKGMKAQEGARERRGAQRGAEKQTKKGVREM